MRYAVFFASFSFLFTLHSAQRKIMRRHAERHLNTRIGWLRAAVLGANDGIVSTASLLVGVAAASSTQSVLVLTGIAALVAGAMSMAAGEYVSVHSQADTEKADLSRERAELSADPAAEQRELAAIYVGRGLDAGLAEQVARQLMAHDALGAHARDELGISAAFSAQPTQAALASAASFAAGAILPLAVTALAPAAHLVAWIALTSLVFLAVLGALAAKAGGANAILGAWRVTFWGGLAMAVTAVVGAWFGTTV
jgi:VIT1/CCC1 family predicted Fe2+/Mn2+ transporter